MHHTFLDEVATDIRQRWESVFPDVLLLVPSRRSVHFLKRALISSGQGPEVLPTILSIEDFIIRLTGFQAPDPSYLLIELYRHYERAVPDPQPFETFLQWAPTLLQDFNEIDAQNVPAAECFRSLSDIKQLESWNAEGGEPTEIQKNYLGFWQYMDPLYHGFREALLKAGTPYAGLAARHGAAHWDQLFPTRFPNTRHLAWVGFNALNETESLWIDAAIQNHEVRLYWDADAHYLQDEVQEAGSFLRKNTQRWPEQAQVMLYRGFETADKSIQVHAAQGGLTQAKTVGNLLQSLPPEEAERTWVILGDESLLFPVLESIPDTLPHVNLTLGLPMQASTYWDLVMRYIDAYVQADGTRSDPFHHREILALLDHSVFSGWHVWQQQISGWRSHLIRNRTVWVDPKEWPVSEAATRTVLEDLFQHPAEVQDPVQQLERFLFHLKEQAVAPPRLTALYQVQQAVLEQAVTHCARLQQQGKQMFSWRVLRQFLALVVSRYPVDVVGEPVQGLQIMGVLETRTLDAHRIIMVSVNEGILPAGKGGQSFVPLDVKRAFGIPTHREKDAIYAYHFYRALQRAAEVHLVFDASVHPLTGGEESRFIRQLEYELSRAGSLVRWSRTSEEWPVPSEGAASWSVPKTPAVLEALKSKLERGLSPSAINSYINSPRDFYLRYLLEIREPEMFREDVDHSVFGDVIHEVLHRWLEPYVSDTPMDVAQWETATEGLTDQVRKHFREEHHLDIHTGTNFLRVQLASEFIQRLVEMERKRLSKTPVALVALEASLKHTLLLDGWNICFNGIADRIERAGAEYRILDYKTGKVDARELQAESVSELFEKREKSKALQLLLYAWLFHQQDTTRTELRAGIISLPNLQSGILPLKIEKQEVITTDHFQQVEEHLLKMIRDMRDPEVPWVGTETEKYTLFPD